MIECYLHADFPFYHERFQKRDFWHKRHLKDANVNRVGDSYGKLTVTVVSRYSPPGYDERVFYRYSFTNPKGVHVEQKRLWVELSSDFDEWMKAFERADYEPGPQPKGKDRPHV